MGGALGTLSGVITGSPNQRVRNSIIMMIIVGLASALVWALLTSGCGDQTVDVNQESNNLLNVTQNTNINQTKITNESMETNCSPNVTTKINNTGNQNFFSDNKIIMGKQVCGECDCGNNTVNVIQDFSKIEGIMKTGFTAKHNDFVNVYIVTGVLVLLVITNCLLVFLVFSHQRTYGMRLVDENTYNYCTRPRNIQEPEIEY